MLHIDRSGRNVRRTAHTAVCMPLAVPAYIYKIPVRAHTQLARFAKRRLNAGTRRGRWRADAP